MKSPSRYSASFGVRVGKGVVDRRHRKFGAPMAHRSLNRGAFRRAVSRAVRRVPGAATSKPAARRRRGRPSFDGDGRVRGGIQHRNIRLCERTSRRLAIFSRYSRHRDTTSITRRGRRIGRALLFRQSLYSEKEKSSFANNGIRLLGIGSGTALAADQLVILPTRRQAPALLRHRRLAGVWRENVIIIVA